ncbi:hypothetical protein ACQ1R0_03915 [Ornithobacterium rhinotracheale]|uniref:hypothetical protein n=1 Tax=Ornithobacterium rhinotracheale TaxID=28251 RepID=UPI004035AB70
MKKKINIAVAHRKKLEQEFGLTPEWVRTIMRGHTNSELSNKVRARAKELLKEEAKKVELI